MKEALRFYGWTPLCLVVIMTAAGCSSSESTGVTDMERSAGLAEVERISNEIDETTEVLLAATRAPASRVEGWCFPTVRRSAVIALAKLSGPRVDRAITAALVSDQPDLRGAAARVCRLKRDKKMIPFLVPLLDDQRFSQEVLLWKSVWGELDYSVVNFQVRELALDALQVISNIDVGYHDRLQPSRQRLTGLCDEMRAKLTEAGLLTAVVPTENSLLPKTPSDRDSD